MTDTKLTVKVNADTDEAVEAINEVTEAVEELEAALNRLQSTKVSIDYNVPNSSFQTDNSTTGTFEVTN